MHTLEEWYTERNKHPFFGEKLSSESICEIWDRSAATYEEGPMKGMRESIMRKMSEKGILSKERSVMDVGCGPGTFAIGFASVSKNVVCIDSSPKMLEHLETAISDSKVNNICVIKADWNVYSSDVSCDIVFSSLCPPLNDPKGILKMEVFSNEICVYVSSMNDDTGSLHTEIWNKFGKDYTFNGYNTNYPRSFLKSIGRSPELDVFEISEPYQQKEEDLIATEIKNFSRYFCIDDEKRKIIADTVGSRSEDGYVHFNGHKKLGMLTWTPGRMM